MYTIKDNSNDYYINRDKGLTRNYSNLITFYTKSQAKRYLLEQLDSDKKYEIIRIK